MTTPETLWPELEYVPEPHLKTIPEWLAERKTGRVAKPVAHTDSSWTEPRMTIPEWMAKRNAPTTKDRNED